MHSRNQAQGGSKPDPPQLFSLAFAVGVICFPGGVQPPQPPANFYPGTTILPSVVTNTSLQVFKYFTKYWGQNQYLNTI